MTLWLRLSLKKVLLSKAWNSSMPSIVDVLGWEHSVWPVELVSLVSGEFHVVFDTVSILIIDVSLEQLKVLWACHKHVVLVELFLGFGPVVEGVGAV